MTRFDDCLRRGMMDANIAQYEYAIQKAASQELDASPRYFRERMRLLADPWTWAKRRTSVRGKRLNWRLIAIVAALLLLSACAYAVVTGQFSQWFPRRGVNPQAPNISENVLGRMGTGIEQSHTVGNTTVTLNAALWDGSYVYLSLVIESPNIPEEVIRYTPLYTNKCWLRLREDQWKEYERKSLENFYASTGQPLDQLETDLQAKLDRGQMGFDLGFDVLSREGNTLTFQLMKPLFAYIERPELTLHLENIATFGDEEDIFNPEPDEFIWEDPVDFTFTLEELLLPINYEGASVEVTLMDVPLRFTEFKVSATEVIARFEVLAPVDLPKPGEAPDPDKLNYQAVTLAAMEGVRGLWTEDGKYVDLTDMGSSGGSDSAGRSYPYPIDPATVTAVDIAGTRVELSEMKVVLPE